MRNPSHPLIIPFILAAFSGAVVLGARLLAWQLSCRMIAPLIEGFGAVVAFITATFCLAYGVLHFRGRRWAAFVPLLVLVGILAVSLAVPGSHLDEGEDFRRYRSARERIVSILRGERLRRLATNRHLCELPWWGRHLSDGGEILVERKGDRLKVYFWTFRGLINGGSTGFLYADDGNPETGLLAATETERLSDRWFRIREDD